MFRVILWIFAFYTTWLYFTANYIKNWKKDWVLDQAIFRIKWLENIAKKEWIDSSSYLVSKKNLLQLIENAIISINNNYLILIDKNTTPMVNSLLKNYKEKIENDTFEYTHSNNQNLFYADLEYLESINKLSIWELIKSNIFNIKTNLVKTDIKNQTNNIF